MSASEDYWISQYQQKGAYWLHDDNDLRPHALLTSGNHSNGFFNSEQILEDSLLLNDAAFGLVEGLTDAGLDMLEVDRVVGPAMGAITLAHDVARTIARQRSSPCLRAYVEKDGNGKMLFTRTHITPGERVLLVEDVLTTGGSVIRTAEAVREAGGIVLPFVGVLVNRSGQPDAGGLRVVALVERDMPIWNPDECPLCEKGSEAIRPKQADNWQRLGATY